MNQLRAGAHGTRATPVEGWTIARLDAVADLFSGGTPSKRRPEWWRGPIPWASPKDMKHLRLRDTIDHVSKEGVKAGSRLVPPKTIFVVVRGMILAKALPVAMAETPMAFNQDMKAVVARAGVDPEYLLYALASQRDALSRHIGTSAHGTRRLGSSSLEALELPIPPISEQHAIALVLSEIQAAVDIQAETVRTLRALKAATMARLFRQGLRDEPLKQTEIGEIPASWDVLRLGEVTQKMNYGTSARCVVDGPGRPVLRIPNVIDERIASDDLKYAALPEHEVVKLALHPGDLLFVRTNGNRLYTGRCAVYLGIPADALFASYLIRVRIDGSQLLPEFVQAYLSSTGRHQITSAASSASDGKFNIDTGTLRRLLVPRPTLGEQRGIARAIHAVDVRLAGAVRRSHHVQRLFTAMLEALLTGRTRLTPSIIAKLSSKGADTVARPTGNAPDEAMVKGIVRCIVEAVAPDKIILFGSAARGEMGPDSDLDFLVVKGGMGPHEATRAVYAALYRDRRGPGVPVDVIVVTPEDVERYRDLVGTIIKPALAEGRVLYAA